MSTPAEQLPPMTPAEAAVDRQRTFWSSLFVISIATFGFWKWQRPGEETWAILVGGVWAGACARWAFDKFIAFRIARPV